MQQNEQQAAKASAADVRAGLVHVLTWAAIDLELAADALKLVYRAEPSRLGNEALATLGFLALDDVRERAVAAIGRLVEAAGKGRK